jgi:hypothetical protein
VNTAARHAVLIVAFVIGFIALLFAAVMFQLVRFH